jgi:hypothetical protein
LWQALLDKHPTGTIFVAWDTASMHEDEEIEDVVRAAAGRPVLLSLPTYSPWLKPIEMRCRHFRWEVTHCELFETKRALPAAAQDCFDRFNQCPQKILSVIGSNAAKTKCFQREVAEWVQPSATQHQATGIFLDGDSASSTWKHLGDCTKLAI